VVRLSTTFETESARCELNLASSIRRRPSRNAAGRECAGGRAARYREGVSIRRAKVLRS